MTIEEFLSFRERHLLAALLTATAKVLLIIFLLSVVVTPFPPRLLDPLWLMTFTGAASSNGLLALLATAMVHLAAAMSPEDMRLQHRRFQLVALCRFLPIAFIMLIPLHITSSFFALEAAQFSQAERSTQELRQLKSFRDAVSNANSLESMNSNLSRINAPTLSKDDEAMGLSALQTNLLQQVEQVEQQIKKQRKSFSPAWSPAIKATIQVVLLSIVLSIGFKASASFDLLNHLQN